MTGNRSLELPPEEVARLFKEGRMVILEPPKPSKPEGEKPEEESSMIEQAKEILGPDFLGEEAVRNMEEKLKGVGVDVKFVTRENGNLPPFSYTKEDLQLAKTNGEMLVLRPEAMSLRRENVPIMLIRFRELFRKDPLGKKSALFYLGLNKWYETEPFATEPGQINLGWALVKKDVLDGSTNTDWNSQEQLLKQYEADLRGKGAKNASVRRRTAAETVYDELLYYVNTGKRLLLNKYDWTQTRTPAGHFVYVGYFGSDGLGVGSFSPERSSSFYGVCPSR